MHKSIPDKKKDYNARITIYTKRRQELRDKLGVNPLSRRPLTEIEKKALIVYKKKVVYLNKRIQEWGKTLKRMEKRLNQIKSLERAVVAFTGTQLKYYVSIDANYKLARSLYYTYGLENGMRGVDLNDYIRITYRQTAARSRSRFRASFKTKPENLQLWQGFCRFYNTKNKSN